MEKGRRKSYKAKDIILKYWEVHSVALYERYIIENHRSLDLSLPQDRVCQSNQLLPRYPENGGQGTTNEDHEESSHWKNIHPTLQ
jgi:hypothetical protein